MIPMLLVQPLRSSDSLPTIDDLATAAQQRLVASAAAGDSAAAVILARHHLKSSDSRQDHEAALRLLQQAATAGLDDAARLLADTYRAGTGLLAPDPVRAVPLYEKFAAAGDNAARRTLATLLLAGQGTIRNPARARDLLRDAADSGSLEARLALAGLLARGDVLAGDGIQALALYEGGLPDRVAPALLGLGDLYRRGAVGVGQDPAQALTFYRAAMEGGDTQATLAVADMTLRGEGIEADEAAAIAILSQLAPSDASAFLVLGDYFVRGDAVKLDAEAAEAYYRKARDAGSLAATVRLADLYRSGAGTIERDLDAAYELYGKAAANGDRSAARRQAEMLARGEGVASDFPAAVGQLEELAAKGDSPSLLVAGDLYLIGSLAPIDSAQAIAFYQRAADAGQVAGLTKIADLYRAGLPGTAPDRDKAIAYYQKAIAANDNGARRTLATLLWTGSDDEADAAAAVALLEAAIADGDASSAILLGQLQARGGPMAADYEAAKASFALARARGLLIADARFGVALLEGPLAETRANEGATLLKAAVAEGIPGAIMDLARLQVAGRVPGDTARTAIATLEPLAQAGDIAAVRYLLTLYRDGAGKLLSPAHSKARDLLEKSAILLGPDVARQERILLVAASAASPSSLGAMLEDYTALPAATQFSMLQRLGTSYQNAYIYLVQHWLMQQGDYAGGTTGMLTAETVRALNRLCAAADADLICSQGLLERDAIAVIAAYMLRPRPAETKPVDMDRG